MRRFSCLFATAPVLLTGLALFSCSDDPTAPLGPPPPVQDLAVIRSDIGALQLSWTVPAAAADQGAVRSYDLRFSADAAADWADWTPAASPAASAAGERDTALVAGLDEGTSYILRIRTRGTDGQYSEPSAPATGVTGAGDPTAPPGVDDLALIGVEADALRVSWTVPAAVGYQGDVSVYDLRYTTTPAAAWDDWTPVDAPAPAAVGARDTVLIAGLATGVDHAVRLRTGSDDGLWSSPSPALYGTPAAVAGRTWRVAPDGSGDVRRIQEAVDLARSGDTVLVAPGRYYWADMVRPTDRFAIDHGMVYIRRELLDVVIRSEAGPHSTILDGQGRGRLFFVQGYNTGCEIDGFSIVNGVANSFDGYAGGGIVGHLSSPTISNCVFRDNMAIGANDSIGGGGAIWWGGVSEVTIRGCVFEGNEADVGGAVFLAKSSETSTVSDCIFTGNVARRFGGAVGVYSADTVIEGCVMAENVGLESGGAVWVNGTDPDSDVDHTLIIDRCTMVANDAPDAGVRMRDIHDGRILHSILAHGGDGRALSWNLVGELTLTCSDLYGYPDGDAPPPGITDGGGNLSTDPVFCGWTRGDGAVGLELDPASPCADASCGAMGALSIGCQR